MAISIQAAKVENLPKQFDKFVKLQPLFVKSSLGRTLSVVRDTMVDRSTITPLKKFRGRLGRSWGIEIAASDKLDRIQGSSFSFATYSKLHELGGTATAHAGRWLLIPTKNNRDLFGHPIKSPEQVQREGGQFGVFQIRRRGRPGKNIPDRGLVRKTYLYDAEGKTMFLAVKSAEYKPQLGAVDTATKAADPLALDMLEESMAAAVQALGLLTTQLVRHRAFAGLA